MSLHEEDTWSLFRFHTTTTTALGCNGLGALQSPVFASSMAFTLSSTFNVPTTLDPSPTLSPTLSLFHRSKKTSLPPSRIFCFSKNHHFANGDTSAEIGARIMNKLKNVIPIIFAASVPFSIMFPLVDSLPYVSPEATAVLYSPDTKVPRTGEVALRKAIPANPNMKAITVPLYLYAFKF